MNLVISHEPKYSTRVKRYAELTRIVSVRNIDKKLYDNKVFKFTSQANHMQKLLQLKKDYEREGFHLQRLYKRRIMDVNGVYHSNLGKIMETPAAMPKEQGGPPHDD